MLIMIMIFLILHYMSSYMMLCNSMSANAHYVILCYPLPVLQFKFQWMLSYPLEYILLVVGSIEMVSSLRIVLISLSFDIIEYIYYRIDMLFCWNSREVEGNTTIRK